MRKYWLNTASICRKIRNIYSTFIFCYIFHRRNNQPSVKQTFAELTLPENTGYKFKLILTSVLVVRASDAAEVASLFKMIKPI
jgi:hypothetical protein